MRYPPDLLLIMPQRSANVHAAVICGTAPAGVGTAPVIQWGTFLFAEGQDRMFLAVSPEQTLSAVPVPQQGLPAFGGSFVMNVSFCIGVLPFTK
jgi:hypothetical protein